MVNETPPIKKILLPIDGSDASFKAARYAVKLAKMAGAEIICVHSVVNPSYVEYKNAGLVILRFIEEAKRHAQKWYDQVETIAAKEGIKVSSVETILDVASVHNSIVNYAARQKADLIVIGTKGRTGLKKILLGSVAAGVVSHAKCPVMVVR